MTEVKFLKVSFSHKEYVIISIYLKAYTETHWIDRNNSWLGSEDLNQGVWCCRIVYDPLDYKVTKAFYLRLTNGLLRSQSHHMTHKDEGKLTPLWVAGKSKSPPQTLQ